MKSVVYGSGVGGGGRDGGGRGIMLSRVRIMCRRLLRIRDFSF